MPAEDCAYSANTPLPRHRHQMDGGSSAHSSMDLDLHNIASSSIRACEACCCPASGDARQGALNWLPGLLRHQFFTPCRSHRDHKKCEVTHFCVTCGSDCGPLCPHCLPAHAGHQTLQVRRYVYCDVVRASDMAGHVDVTGVQSYIINQAKVIFLNPRPNSKLAVPGVEDGCLNCNRCLREGCSYCCLSCRVESLVQSGELDLPAFPISSDSSEDCNVPLGGEGDFHSAALLGEPFPPRVQRRLDPLVRSGSARSSTDGSDLESFPSSGLGPYSRRKQMSPRRSPVY